MISHKQATNFLHGVVYLYLQAGRLLESIIY